MDSAGVLSLLEELLLAAAGGEGQSHGQGQNCAHPSSSHTVSFLSGVFLPRRRGMMKKMNRFAKRFMEYTENLSLENRTSPNSQ